MISEREELFNIGTKKLAKLATDYEVNIRGRLSFPYIVEKLRESFKDPNVYYQVFGW
ncbi:MAG TPA: hypothetical protein PKJ33_01890 [Alphaproteobacteria bacterium]|nr:hypothetical protein [Alphaproteobacteria bacterium]